MKKNFNIKILTVLYLTFFVISMHLLLSQLRQLVSIRFNKTLKNTGKKHLIYIYQHLQNDMVMHFQRKMCLKHENNCKCLVIDSANASYSYCHVINELTMWWLLFNIFITTRHCLSFILKEKTNVDNQGCQLIN